MGNNDKKYDNNDLQDFDNRFNDLLAQCNEINGIVDKEDNTKYDIVKSYSTYLLFSGAIETLLNQAILFRFDVMTLKYFGYFANNRGNFIDEEHFIELLDSQWIDNIDYSKVIESLKTKYDIKLIRNECYDLNSSRIKDIYKDCRTIRNKLAHTIKRENIEFSKSTCCKFEIIICIIHMFVDEKINQNTII